MKRTRFLPLYISALALAMTSCHDYLDNLPLDKYPDETVWKNAASAQVFVNGTYPIISDFLVGNDDWSDNTVPNPERASALIREEITEDNDFGWNQYGYIRRCNLILEKVEASDFLQTDKDLLMGEAYFLRATVNFSQARKFGRLMIVEKVLTPADEMELSRTVTIKETYDKILGDLDEAAKRLPVDVKTGRISRGAAYALKAEACLQGAAYLENADDKADYYRQAKAASEALFTLNKYELDSDFKGMFNDFDKGSNSNEIILAVYRLSENTSFSGTWMQELFPNMNQDKATEGVWEKWPLADKAFEGWMDRTPSHDLTDAYLVVDKDGVAKHWSETAYYRDFTEGKQKWVHPAIYEHRDKRFEATIVCDSSMLLNSLVTTRVGGNIHYLSNKEQTRHVTKTGYTYRKGLYESKWIWYETPTDYHYVVLRLGRAYLNYVETMLRLKDKDKAIEYLNKTRITHGELPALPTSTSMEDVWKYYKIERQAELVQENDRYWSLLRWGKEENLDVIPELNTIPHAIEIAADGQSFQVIEIPDIIRAANDRKFTKRRYLLPVPRSERNENPNLANDQNPGW